MTVFEAYITNLGKYAEGQLMGETLKFPATTEEVQSLLKNIGVDGVRYEEFFITAFDGDVMGLYDYLTEYENLDELNHLAHLISELDSDEIETLEAVLNKGDHTSSVADIINLVHNLDCYSFHPSVSDDETLGRIYVEDMELLEVPDNVLPYFDFEAYGRDMRINEGGHFAPTGYLTRSGDFKEVYHGIEDIPAEHRIFAYTGVLRSGESRSQTLPHLQIITPELFEAAQHIRTSRANSAEQERRVPLNTRGQSLLAGNVFCGHCGSRLALTTNGKAYPCKENAHRIVKRVRYICYGKTRKQTECDGQTGYTAHILDGIIDKVVRQIFERMKGIPKSEIVNIRYREKMEERKTLLKSAKSDYAKAAAELDTLRAEVIKSLRGESAFSQDLLGSLISDCETKWRC